MITACLSLLEEDENEDEVIVIGDDDDEYIPNQSQETIPMEKETKLLVTDFVSSDVYSANYAKKILRKLDSLETITKDLKEYDHYFELLKLYWYTIKDLENRFCHYKIKKKATVLEEKLIVKIHKVYNEAIKLFPNKFPLYSTYFLFVKDHLNDEQLTTETIEQMCEGCPTEPDMWLTIAKWYKETGSDTDNAIAVIDAALQTHKVKDLYLYSIQLKLDHLAEVIAPLDKQNYCVEVIGKDVNDYCDFNKNFEDIMNLFNSIQDIKHTMLIQNIIIDKMMEYYKDEFILWTTLAEREKRGVRYGQSCGSNLQNSFATYELGLQYVNPKMKVELWSHYLSTVLESEPDLKLIDMNSTFMKAFEEDCLDFKFYPKIIPLLSKELAFKVLEKGATKFSKSVDFWQSYLRYTIKHDTEENVYKIFQAAVEHTQEEALPLWITIIVYYQNFDNEEKLKSIYSAGIKEHEKISSELKLKYLRWVFLTKEIEEARKLYWTLANMEPYCKELHLMMAKLEACEVEQDFENTRAVLELACQQFGKTDIEVWITLESWYKHVEKDIKKAKAVLEQAKNSLPSSLYSEFEQTIIKPSTQTS